MALVTDITASRITPATAIPTEVPEIIWATPEAKLWIATREGEYAGMVEYAEGHFVASGPIGDDLGSFSDVAQAQAAVARGVALRRFGDGLLSNVAIVSAVVAVSLAGMSLTMIAA